MTTPQSALPRPHQPQHTDEHLWHALSEPERRAIRAVFAHRQKVKNVNEIEEEKLTPGERIADSVARVMGSWRFIIIQSVILIGWIFLNALAWIHHWDPYPFILLNLALSFQAAYSAPIIMMSQNRQATKDRLTAESDYHVNLHSEVEVAAIHGKLDGLIGEQWNNLVELQQKQLELLERIDRLTAQLHQLTSERG
ncbi:MAG TPA: DUF1003 domain-containing protein [Thermomicrobiales bacterium]|nr:DUF1003 domain-containing protein [Thermomicrobiales bacterium]